VYPSWVPFVNDFEICSCSFGVFTGFHYNAFAGATPYQPLVVGNKLLEVKGLVIDAVSRTYEFSTGDLKNKEEGVIHRIWDDIHDPQTPCAYTEEEKTDAFSLTLCAGLSTYNSAEDNIEQHRADFAAFWKSTTPPVMKGRRGSRSRLQWRSENEFIFQLLVI
jgi:hypothetical protein